MFVLRVPRDRRRTIKSVAPSWKREQKREFQTHLQKSRFPSKAFGDSDPGCFDLGNSHFFILKQDESWLDTNSVYQIEDMVSLL